MQPGKGTVLKNWRLALKKQESEEKKTKLFAADDIGSPHPPARQASLYLPHRETKITREEGELTIMSVLADEAMGCGQSQRQ